MSIAKGTGYVKGPRATIVKKLASHFKYLEYRPRGAEETRADRALFSESQDRVSRHDALAEVIDHTHQSVGFHKIVLSPSIEEPIEDWRTWTREVMEDLAGLQGKDLHWYAVLHQNTDSPHIHVVLAGAGEHRATGKREAIKLYARDYEVLRQSGRTHSQYAHHQKRQHEQEGWNQKLTDFYQEAGRFDTIQEEFARAQVRQRQKGFER